MKGQWAQQIVFPRNRKDYEVAKGLRNTRTRYYNGQGWGSSITNEDRHKLNVMLVKIMDKGRHK